MIKKNVNEIVMLTNIIYCMPSLAWGALYVASHLILKQFCEVKATDDWSVFPETFKTDRALFCIHFVQLAVEFREMESDFLI